MKSHGHNIPCASKRIYLDANQVMVRISQQLKQGSNSLQNTENKPPCLVSFFICGLFDFFTAPENVLPLIEPTNNFIYYNRKLNMLKNANSFLEMHSCTRVQEKKKYSIY